MDRTRDRHLMDFWKTTFLSPCWIWIFVALSMVDKNQILPSEILRPQRNNSMAFGLTTDQITFLVLNIWNVFVLIYVYLHAHAWVHYECMVYVIYIYIYTYVCVCPCKNMRTCIIPNAVRTHTHQQSQGPAVWDTISLTSLFSLIWSLPKNGGTPKSCKSSYIYIYVYIISRPF